MNWCTGFFYFGNILALVASPLDDKARAFEDALKAAPAVKTADSQSPFARTRLLTPEDLDAMVKRGDQQGAIVSIATQLMALHPSDLVRQTGADFIHAFEDERSAKAQDFTIKATALLAETKTAVTHAQKAADLDTVLGELHGLAGPQVESFAVDASSQELVMRLNMALQFVSSWQSYLSASASGKTEEAQMALRQILGNTQLDGLNYFPRSEILARRDGSSGKPGSTQSPSDAVGAILRTVKKADDVLPALGQIRQIANEPFDFSALYALEHARSDVTAGLPIELDLEKAMNGSVFGDDISRITSMELLVLLPYYLETRDSNPPKPEETLGAYLDRLAAGADSTGNLGLLQRTLSIRMALGGARVSRVDGAPYGSLQSFLAGLSQEAGGQYAPAVVSYEIALKEFDPLLPVKIIGNRLAAIKAAHPNEYNEGMTTFLTPPPPDFRSGGWQPNQPPRPYYVSILPIPMTISIPAHPAINAAPTNAAPPTK